MLVCEKDKEVYVLAARRTPVAPHQGALAHLEVHELAAPVVAALLEDAGAGAEAVDELVLGNALYGGGNPARMAALASGLSERTAGLSLDRQCVSGLDAILLAGTMISAGSADLVIAGGAESASRRPERLRTDPGGGQAVPYDRPPFTPWPDRDPDLHESAAQLAKARGISRKMQDEWAITSHAKALAARERFLAEGVSVAGLNHDSFSRKLTPRLAARAPVIAGTVSHANAAVSADGAAFVLMASRRGLEKLGASASVQLCGGLTLGGDPCMPALAPVAASQRVMAQLGIDAGELAAAEIMEAYAVQAMACTQDLGIDPAVVNRGGGALARGHPIGASGAILAVRLFHELKNKPGFGLASIAAAGGLGTSLMLHA